MSVIIFSRVFQSNHPRKGEPTFFIEKIWKGLKTENSRDGEYSIWTKYPILMKDGHWQLPHLYRDQMMDKKFFPKFHTIRAGNRWKVGDFFSPRVWSGKPYRSKQIQFAPAIEIKKIWDIEIYGLTWLLNSKPINSLTIQNIAKNDGLNYEDFKKWFSPLPFVGQIICWNQSVNY